ncbi:MAG TPA: GtrA family protein [Candidatus Saccharimonadales bacterium]|nr:GtrA family protein [Candidatus Saccharimonadales bacterium]
MIGVVTLQRLWAKSFMRYVVIGGTAYITEIASLMLLTTVFDLSSVIAVAISFWVGFIVAFTLQKIVTFNNYDKTVKGLARQVVGYGALVAWNYAFTLSVVGFVGDRLPVYVSRTLCIVVITCWNFLIYRKLFKQTQSDEQEV